jgi:DNA-directed RNA polymerase specialized sigma24 family protein
MSTSAPDEIANNEMMRAVTAASPEKRSSRLADPELRRMLERFVRRRVPAAEVDDVVQTVFVDALASENMPDDREQLRKWLMGITRHKVADLHRHGARKRRLELPAEIPDGEAPESAREWASWAEKQTEGDAEAQRTLGWMAREGGGEKLAHIAADEKLPATQIRQRVSRLRRFMRERWAAELAAVAAVVVAVIVGWLWLTRPKPTAEPILPTPAPETIVPPELEHAQRLREEAFEACEKKEWKNCLERLDEAARLDPKGDRVDGVRAARGEAERELEEQKKQEELKKEEELQNLRDKGELEKESFNKKELDEPPVQKKLDQKAKPPPAPLRKKAPAPKKRPLKEPPQEEPPDEINQMQQAPPQQPVFDKKK